MHNLVCIKSMHSVPFEWRARDGRNEHGEKVMKEDEGSSESSSLLPEFQSEKPEVDVKYE